MKIRRIVLNVFVIIWGLWCPTLAGAKNTINVIGFYYPPYLNGDETGLMETVVNEALMNVEMDTVWKYYPVERAVMNFNRSEQSDRPTIFVGAKPYVPDALFLDMLAFDQLFIYDTTKYETVDLKSLDDLENKSIGVLLNSGIGRFLASKGLTIEETQIENNIMKLEKHRIDFFAMADLTALHIVKNAQKEGQKFAVCSLPEPFSSYSGLATHASRPDLFKKISEGFEMLVASGRFRELLLQYYGEEYLPHEYSENAQLNSTNSILQPCEGMTPSQGFFSVSGSV